MSEQYPQNGQGPAAANLTVPTHVSLEQDSFAYMAGRLEACEVGGTYTISPDTSIYPSADIGQPSTLQDGTTISVVAEVGIPTTADREKQINGGLVFAVLACRTPAGRVFYALSGLAPDKSGKMAIANGNSPQWINPEVGELHVGRSTEENHVKAGGMWGASGMYGPVTSRTHVTFRSGSDGSLTMETKGRYGTCAKFGSREGAPGAGHAAHKEMISRSETITPTHELRFQPAEDDPVFQALAAPFKAQLEAVERKHKDAIARADAGLSAAASAGPAAYDKASSVRTAAYRALAEEQSPIRAQLKEASIPYLLARRDLFRGDNAPGYNNHGQAQYDHTKQGVISKGGKQVSRRINTTRNGEGVYASDTPKLGQLVLGQGLTWRGVPNGYVYIGGEQISADQLIIDLAADMVSGRGANYDLPVTYYRDESADAGLEKNLRGSMPVFRVHEGAAYVIASRLVFGNDKALYGAQQIQPRIFAGRS